MRYRSYVLCTSPRSGSTLLCRLLAATGVAGHPDSHFHKPSVEGWLAAWDLRREDFATEEAALAAAVAAAQAEGTGPNGVFGLRLQRGSAGFFCAALGRLHPGLASDRARIEAAFGPTLFVHLTRPDKLAQAVSCVKAIQTGLWHRAPDGTEIERQAPPREPQYDAPAIAAHVAEFTRFDAAWQDWFAAEGIAPLRLTYDALAADPGAVLAQVLDALGLEPGLARDVPLPVARLADAVNADWAARFRAGA